MNLPRPFLFRPNPFRPAIDLLTNHFNTLTNPHPPRTPATNDEPSSMPPSALSTPARSHHSRASSADVDSISGIPLIDFSRTPSPTPYRSGTQSEDDEDGSWGQRPLVKENKGWWRDGGLGAFLFGTWAGWQVYTGLLTAWNVVAAVLLVFFNRVILMYGVYKFPYPLTATWIQLFFCHIFLLIWSSTSRALAQPLRKIGLSSLVAPINTNTPRPSKFHCAGIAGAGVLDFSLHSAKTALPLALVFTGKVVLSNISSAYAPPALYSLCRIGILPLSLVLTSTLARTTHSIPTLSSSLIAWLNLLLASVRTRSWVSADAVVAGVFSIFFVALYPILLDRTHKALIAGQTPAGTVLSTFTTGIESGSKQSTRAYYQLLHYNSILSLILLSPLVLLSGELPRIARNCYFLDVFWFWFVCACSGFAAFAVFSSNLALVRATSPLTATFVGVPRAAAQVLVFSNFRLPVHSWVGVVLCWVSSAWYVVVRREEGRLVEKRRLEGR